MSMDKTRCSRCNKSYPMHTGVIFHYIYGPVCSPCLKSIPQKPRGA